MDAMMPPMLARQRFIPLAPRRLGPVPARPQKTAYRPEHEEQADNESADSLEGSCEKPVARHTRHRDGGHQYRHAATEIGQIAGFRDRRNL